MEKSRVIAAVCEALRQGEPSTASRLLRSHYAFAPDAVMERRYGPRESMRVFVRDGFVDRYSGQPLVLPAALRVISTALPSDFPFHPNWKADVTHPAFWELGATVDHLVPVTRGGADDESNWVTTSMAHNSAKMNWTLSELGWALHSGGDIRDWDGLTGWFIEYVAAHPEALANGSLRQWHRAAIAELT